jgi:hypothetical protein
VAWRLDVIRNCPAPGGEPLWRVPFRPREFRLDTNPAETCKNRRLPGMTQRFAALRPGVSDSESQIKSLHWVIPGSRLLRHFLVGLNAETTIAGSSATRLSGSPPGAGQSRVASTRHATSRTRTTTKDVAHAGSGSACVPALRMIERIKAQAPWRKHSRHSGASPYQRTRKAVGIHEPKSLFSAPPDEQRRRFRYPSPIGTAIFVCRIVETLAPKAQTAIV